VPSVPGPLYIETTSQFSLHTASVGVGIAQHAVDDIVALAGNQKRRIFAAATLAEAPMFQHALARADRAEGCARPAQKRGRIFLGLAERRPRTNSGRASSMLRDGAWAAARAASVVDVCYKAGGGTSLYDSSPLQRHLRDINTLTQHIAVADGWFTRAGAFLVGKDPGFGIGQLRAD
jgi:indole-3-acetate monooxygenase